MTSAQSPIPFKILCINRLTRTRSVFQNLTSESTLGELQQCIHTQLKIPAEKQILYFSDVPPRIIEFQDVNSTLGSIGVHNNVSIEVREGMPSRGHEPNNIQVVASAAAASCTQPASQHATTHTSSIEPIATNAASVATTNSTEPSNKNGLEKMEETKPANASRKTITGNKRAHNESAIAAHAPDSADPVDNADSAASRPSKKLRTAAVSIDTEAQDTEEGVRAPLPDYREQLIPDANGHTGRRRRLLSQRTVDDIYDTVVCAKWKCDACTLENKGNAEKCKACQTPCSKAHRTASREDVVPIERIEIVDHILGASGKSRA